MEEAKEIVVDVKERREVIIPTLKEKIEAKVAEYNALIEENEEAPAKELKKIEGEWEEMLAEYNASSMNDCFYSCTHAELPAMVEACRVLEYPALKVSDVKSERLVKPKEVVDTTRRIDLQKLNKYAEGGIGEDKFWYHTVQELNLYLCYRASLDLKGSALVNWKAIHDSIAMKEVVRKSIDDTTGAPAVSNGRLLKELQHVINNMIGPEYKATSHDVRYLLYTYLGKGRDALTLKASTPGNLLKNLAVVCHRIINDEAYDVSYKTTVKREKKNKEKKAEKAVKVEEKPIEETPAVVVEEIAA